MAGTYGHKQLPRLQQQKAQETKYLQSRSGTVWERNYNKVSELTKKNNWTGIWQRKLSQLETNRI